MKIQIIEENFTRRVEIETSQLLFVRERVPATAPRVMASTICHELDGNVRVGFVVRGLGNSAFEAIADLGELLKENSSIS